MIRKFLLMVSFLALAAQGSTVLAAGDDVTIGDNTNRATFKWSGSTLTVTGKGKLDNAKAYTFTSSAKDRVYTKNGESYTSVASGDVYNSTQTYYGKTYSNVINKNGKPTNTDGEYYSTTLLVPEGYYVYKCELYNSSKGDGSQVNYLGVELTEKITDNTTLTSRSDWNTVNSGYAAPKDGHYNYCLVKGNATVTEGKTSVTYQFTSENIDSDGNYNNGGIQIIPLTPENRDSYLPFGIQSKSDQLYVKTGDNSYTQIANGTSRAYTLGDLYYAFGSICTGSALNSSSLASNDYYDVHKNIMRLKGEYNDYRIAKAQLSANDKGGYILKLSQPETDGSFISEKEDWNTTDEVNSTIYYRYVLVKGENLDAMEWGYSGSIEESVTSDNLSEGKLTICSTGNSAEVVFLTTANRNNYFATHTILVPKQGKTFWAKSGTTLKLVPTRSEYYFTDADQLYAPNTTETTVTESYYELTNSTDIEGTELINGNTTFVEFLNKQLESNPTTVIFNSEDSSNPAEISNAITRALVKCSSITTLNLEDTYLESIKGHNPTLVGPAPNYAPTEDPTFYLGELGKYGTETNKTLTTLYMPSTKNGSTLALEGTANSNNWTVFQFLTGLQTLFLSEGIETIDEYALKVGADNWVDGVTHKFMPTNVILPNTLKNIKAHAFDGQTAIETFVFPAKMEYIQEGAFQSANPKDVYFLGVEAPKVEKNAWGDNSYISNNSLNLEAETSISDGGEVTLKVKLAEGVATRNTYNTKNGWMTMLHYPAACTKEQAARYTDITRKYVKIDYGTETDLVKAETNNNVTVYAYTPGKETSEITGKTEKTTNAAQTKFFNRYNDGTSYSGDYNGGYDDIFLGAQYIWPSMPMAYRATVVAQNNLLWDGVTSIAQGIKNAGGSYSGDGTDYIGLHQFVFAQADVTATDTKKWTIASKYGDGKWHTICLPFDMTKAQMKEAFGPTDDEGNYNIRLCKFNKVLRVTDTENDRLKLYFNAEQFTNAQDDATVLKAHVSYMIKAGKENAVDKQEIVMKNYIMASGNPLPTSVNVTTSAEEGTSTLSEAQYYFIGNYTKDMRIPQYTYFFSKATGKYRFEMGTSTGTNPTSGKWNAYSSVVEASDGEADYNKFFMTGSSEAKLYTKFEDDGDKGTTGIQKITIEAGGEVVSTNENVYNLNGQLVSTEGLGGLQKGIYILNGKKFIVK